MVDVVEVFVLVEVLIAVVFEEVTLEMLVFFVVDALLAVYEEMRSATGFAMEGVPEAKELGEGGTEDWAFVNVSIDIEKTVRWRELQRRWRQEPKQRYF